jgi:hypothetical protein
MFLLPEVKWPRCEADRSQPSSTEVMNAWSYTSSPPYAFMVYTEATSLCFISCTITHT